MIIRHISEAQAVLVSLVLCAISSASCAQELNIDDVLGIERAVAAASSVLADFHTNTYFPPQALPVSKDPRTDADPGFLKRARRSHDVPDDWTMAWTSGNVVTQQRGKLWFADKAEHHDVMRRTWVQAARNVSWTSMHTDEMKLNRGAIRPGKPSLQSWTLHELPLVAAMDPSLVMLSIADLKEWKISQAVARRRCGLRISSRYIRFQAP